MTHRTLFATGVLAALASLAVMTATAEGPKKRGEPLAYNADAISPRHRALVYQAHTADVKTRGSAIVELQNLRDPGANEVLEALIADPDPLVATWAAAARINRAESFEELSGLGYLVQQRPATRRPYEKRAELLMGEVTSARTALLTMSQAPFLQSKLVDVVLEAPGQELIGLTLTDEDANIRRQAASYLAAKGNAVGHDTVAATYVNAMRYRDDAKQVPWAGGPLYVPGIQWPRREAKELLEALGQWYAYCTRNGLTAEAQQVQNNMRSVGLLRAAGQRR